jgi:hypothetical protein
LIGLLIEDALSIERSDVLFEWTILRHGGTRVEEDTSADVQVSESFKQHGAAWRTAIVEDAQLVEAKVSDGQAAGVRGMEGNFDLVDGYGEAIGDGRL